MKVIIHAEVQCDDCGKALRVKPSQVTPDGAWARKRLMKKLEAMAERHDWRMECPSVWAGDLCHRCLLNERQHSDALGATS